MRMRYIAAVGLLSFVFALLPLPTGWAGTSVLYPPAGTSTSSGGVAIGSGCNPTSASASYTEAIVNYLSCTLSGWLRVSVEAFTVLLSGEDQPNNLLMTSGGATRLTIFSSVTSATSSTVTTVFVGPKTFMAYMGGASETKAFDLTIYGNWQNSTTGGVAVCRLWVPSTASVTHIEERCKPVEANFTFWYYTADVYTSASAASLTVYAMN